MLNQDQMQKLMYLSTLNEVAMRCNTESISEKEYTQIVEPLSDFIHKSLTLKHHIGAQLVFKKFTPEGRVRKHILVIGIENVRESIALPNNLRNIWLYGTTLTPQAPIRMNDARIVVHDKLNYDHVATSIINGSIQCNPQTLNYIESFYLNLVKQLSPEIIQETARPIDETNTLAELLIYHTQISNSPVEVQGLKYMSNGIIEDIVYDRFNKNIADEFARQAQYVISQLNYNSQFSYRGYTDRNRDNMRIRNGGSTYNNEYTNYNYTGYYTSNTNIPKQFR